MRRLSSIILILLVIFVLSFYLPLLYEKVFFKRIAKTHLLFSPATQRFVYSEAIVGPPPLRRARRPKITMPNSCTATRTAPITVGSSSRSSCRSSITKTWSCGGCCRSAWAGESSKRMRSGGIARSWNSSRTTSTTVGPNPFMAASGIQTCQARLVFPEDRFRMTGEAMQFVNADTNAVDEPLTELFTRALKDAGFSFPADPSTANSSF